MRLTVVGCSGSFAGPDSAASCYLVQAEGGDRTWSILLDLGNGALGPLQRHLDPSRLDGIFLTHLHPDHCADLTGLYVRQTYHPQGRQPLLDIWGPEDTSRRFGRMYEGLSPEDLAAVFTGHELADRRPVEVGPLTVTPYAVCHPVPAFGFRVEAGGRVLAYSGDTDSCPDLQPLMANADLALVEAAFVEGRDEVRGIHLTGKRAAEAARDAAARRLILTHLPPWNDPEVVRAEAVQVWGAEVELAAPGRTYRV